MRETMYATEIATGQFNDCRIERIHVKSLAQDEIRFSWWPRGRMKPRPLDLTEQELLPLMKEAITAGVFSDFFLGELRALLDARSSTRLSSGQY